MSEIERRLAAIAGEDGWTRHRVLEELRAEGLAQPEIHDLSRCLHHENATLRAAARMALATLASTDSASHAAGQAELLEALRSDLEDVRILAASALGEAGDPGAGGALVEALADPSPNVAAAAADAVGELGYAPALDPLSELSRTGEFWVRAAAVVALGRLEDERAIPCLEELAREPGLEQPIVEALARIDHPATLPVLQRVHAAVPDQALRAAGRVLATHPRMDAPEWVIEAARADEEALRDAMIREDDPAVARLLGLSGSRESVQCLVALIGPPRWSEAAGTGVLGAPPEPRAAVIFERLDDADPQDLVGLLSLLPPLTDRDRIRRLVPLLQHDSAAVRGAAAEALARAPAAEALPVLSAEIAREGVSPEVIRAIGHLGEAACASLLPLLEEPSVDVRAAAAGALLRCASPGNVEALRKALAREGDPEARAAMLRSLARAAGPDALDALDGALRSQRIELRLAAIEGLGFTGSEAAVPRLEQVMEGSQAERLAAIHSLGHLDHPAAAPVIGRWLSHDDPDVRRAAAREAVALAEAMDAEVVSDMATADDAWIRTCAARIMARTGADAARLEELAERDPDPAVRAAARRGLDGED